MGVPEAEESGPGEFLGPEPPPVGSAAYRKLILRIAACGTGPEYDAAMRPVWQWRGWRAGVEVMVELMGALGANVRAEWMDAFGTIHVDEHVAEMDDDDILRYAHQSAPKQYPDLPRHEALAESIRVGEETRELVQSLIPYWNQAATLLRDAEHMSAMEPARAVFTRWLNDHYRDRRLWAANVGASATHAHWRWRVFPPGDSWVDELVNGGPDLRGSLRWATTEDVQPPVAKKRRTRCCPGCGRHN